MFTEHAGPVDYSGWVRDVLDATFLDSPDRGQRDWRDVAVNAALDASTAEWVWFTEQDLIVTNGADFWGQWERCIARGRALVIPDDNGRFHPAHLLIPRPLVERTTRYFGPVPVDHFYAFSRELFALTRPVNALRTGYRHMQGVSHNHHLMDRDEPPNFRRDEFRAYLADSLRVSVPLHPQWVWRAQQEIRSGHL